MKVSVSGTPVEITGRKAVVGLAALALIAYGGNSYLQQSRTIADAEPVEATIVEASIEVDDSRRSEYEVHVEFTYEYRDTSYRSDRLVPGRTERLYDTRSAASDAISGYETGTTVTAYVDPAAPGQAFLEQRPSKGPLLLAVVGGFSLLVTLFDAIGAQTPGQGTELRPESDYEPTRYRTLFGLDRETVYRASKRLFAGGLALLAVSLVAMAALAIASGPDSSTGQPPTADLSDPRVLVLVGLGLAVAVLAGGVLLYGVWSFTEYRRLRERIPEPRPPSPFRHPTRLVTIAATSDGLDEYGRRVKRTGFAFAMLGLLSLGLALRALVF